MALLMDLGLNGERGGGTAYVQHECSIATYLHHEKIASLSDKPSPCTTCGCAVHALPRPMALSKNSAPVVLGAMPLRKNPSRVAGPPGWVSRVCGSSSKGQPACRA